MAVEPDLFEAAHRLARCYVRDGLSFWDAIQEAARLDPVGGIEAFKTSAMYQLERAESRELRAEIKELERRRDPAAAESEAYEREMESRLALEREHDCLLSPMDYSTT